MGAYEEYLKRIKDNYNFARGPQGTISPFTAGSYAARQALDDAAYAVKPILNSHLAKIGRGANFGVKRVVPVVGGMIGYGIDRSEGEGQARAITSNGIGTAAGMVGSVVGGALFGVPGALVGNAVLSTAGNWLTDRTWELTTQDDGLDRNHPRYQQHKEYVAKQKIEEYNKNPTPENKEKAERAIADSNNVIYQPTSTQAVSALDRYHQIHKELDAFYGPNSKNHQAWRDQAKQDSIFDENQSYRIKDRELSNSMIAAGFDYRNNMAAKNTDAYWNDRNSSRDFIASLWR
jgi:hypothetical protein